MLMREAVSALRRGGGGSAPSTGSAPRAAAAGGLSPGGRDVPLSASYLRLAESFTDTLLSTNISVRTSLLLLRGFEGAVENSVRLVCLQLISSLSKTNVWLVPINGIMGSCSLCSVPSPESCESATCSDMPDGRGHPDISSSCQFGVKMCFRLSTCAPHFLLAH